MGKKVNLAVTGIGKAHRREYRAYVGEQTERQSDMMKTTDLLNDVEGVGVVTGKGSGAHELWGG